MSKLTRRDFMKLAAASAASMAGANFLPGASRLLASPAFQDAVNISFAGWGQTAEQDGVVAAIEVFQQENPGITVEWRHTPDTDFTTVFLSNIAAGTPPDTSFIGSDSYETFRAQGILLDITDQITNDPLLGQPNYFLPQEAQRTADANGRWHGW